MATAKSRKCHIYWHLAATCFCLSRPVLKVVRLDLRQMAAGSGRLLLRKANCSGYSPFAAQNDGL